MIRFYYGSGSPFSWRVQLVLEEKGLPYEPVLLSFEKAEHKGNYLHQGIAARGFKRRFELADHVKVMGADMENGLLYVTLKREEPEAMKPWIVPIRKGPSLTKSPIEAKKAA